MIDYAAYARDLRRQLHRCPEIGFDLPKTLTLVKGELEKWGIPYTEKYGRSSVVATINEEKAAFTIGIRADMDALPLQEVDDGRPYRSEHDGKMHACGHDAHTAILLATGRRLQEMKDQLHCRVKLLFTPAEEYIQPGCKELAENGVMDDIDCIIALHVDHKYPVGTVSFSSGDQGGNSMGFRVKFYGTSSHAAKQHQGKDAIAMAVDAYTAMQVMVAKEIDPVEPRLLNVGSIHGGNTNNIICDHCEMFCSSRTHSDEVSEYIIQRVRQICQSIAQCNGGRAEVEVTKFLPYVINHETMTERMRVAATALLGEEKLLPKQKRSLGGEDFSFLSRKKPAVLVRLGTAGADPNTHAPLHSKNFDIDESCLQVGIDLFTRFVLDNMDGIKL